MMNHENMKKCNAQKARRLYYEGKNIYIIPSKVRIPNMWIDFFQMNVKDQENEKDDFQKRLNAFSYYNCNNELGNRIHFYYIP